MRVLAALFSSVLLLVLLGCGDVLSGGARAPISPPARLPAPPSSVLFGPPGALTGGTLVVGLLVPTPPPARLVDLIGKARMDAFLAEEAARSDDEAEIFVVVDDLLPVGDFGTYRARFQEAAEAVEKAMHVQVLFRDVLARECEGLPVVLASGKIGHEADRRALRPWLDAGGRLFCDACFQHDLGESRPGVLPDGDAAGGSIQVLVATCREILETSTLVARLPQDPREIVEARRDGDDVFVAFRSPPASVSVRDLANVEVADVQVLADGGLRFRSPNTSRDPFFHRLVATWRGEGWTLRRAWRVVDLVGVAERFVFAPGLVEAGATFAPRILFLNSLTGRPVVGCPAHVALLRKGTVLAEVLGRSDVAGSVDALLHVPADVPAGPATLQVGEETFPVQVRRSLRIAVVTDRTLYRPTDEVYVRVMVHDTVRGRPLAGQDVVLRLLDQERRVTTSEHGIASARMRLVDARLGSSAVQASIDGVEASAAFKVSAFERPTFLVTTTPERLVLRPGEVAPVVVHVRAVNGSPLVGAKVVAWTGFPRAQRGVTDATGAFVLDVRWGPKTSVCWVAVSAVDGRYAEVRVPVSLLGDEDRTLIFRPLDEPIVGRPCRIEITASVAGPVHLTDGDGVRHDVTVEAGQPAVVEITPSGARSWLKLSSGLTDTGEQPLGAATVPAGVPVILPERRVATVGDTLRLALEGEGGPVYVDVLRGGTVLRALSVVLDEGRAALDLPLDADLAGVLELRAWNLDPDGTPRGSRVPVLVVRGRPLAVTAKAERASYRPGETAVVDVEVRDRDGTPTAAVLGYWGVDEALLALSPWHEATEEVFDVLPADPKTGTLALARRAERGASLSFDRALSVLGPLSASGDLRADFALRHRSAPTFEEAERKARRAVLDAHGAVLRKLVIEAFGKLPLDALWTAHSLREVFDRLVREGLVAADAFRDPWGSAFDIREVHGAWNIPYEEVEFVRMGWTSERGFPCASGGPDLLPGTGDDLILVWTPPAPWEIGGRVGRFLQRVGEVGLEAGWLGDMPFLGPTYGGFIGLGGGAGGAFRGRGGGRDLGRGRGARASGPAYLRRDFSPTLCFVPEAIVGPDGHARLAIPLADSITTWRLRLVASGATGATGVGESTLRVSQPLHANPWIAPHLTVGDALELPVAVHNETDESMDVVLALSVSPELEVLSASRADVTVAAHGSAAHVFRYRAVGRGRARVRVDATSAAARDAIERIVSVRPREREVVEVMSGSVSSDKPWTALFAALDAGTDREVGVSVYPSPLAETLSGFEGLIACPHG